MTSEELWVIARPKDEIIEAETDMPGCGELRAKRPQQQKEIPLPLKHTEVKAAIAGYIAAVDVTQQYHNPYDEKIEAVYVFPLPHNAAVNEFLMTVGERRIRGIIRERQEAEQIYQEAKAQGYVASLLTQERPNIFTQSVANIEPGKQIDINIRYFNTLAYDDGWYEFVFPMVVGPRFNPPGSTDGVGAVPRGGYGQSGQKTEVQYLKPGERSGHDISLSVDIDAGVPIEEIKSRSHVIETQRPAPEKAVVQLSELDAIPNKDFVLRYQIAGDRIKSAVLTHQDKRGGFFTLMLYPPQDLQSLSREPLELVFVLDCSGSMDGTPIAQAKQAVERALKQMQPQDTFQIIRFSESATQLGRKPLEATPTNVRRGLDYLRSLNSEGGTMMIEGIRAALDFPHDPRRLRFVVFLTDGYIGNESEILTEIGRKLGPSRIFSFGVGSSTNRYLLEGMAKVGRGAVAYLGLNDSGAEVMDAFFRRVSHPGLTDIQVDWGAWRNVEMYPKRIPDLFVGRPVILSGRIDRAEATTIVLRGKAGNEERRIEIPVQFSSQNANESLASVWARMKIAELYDYAAREDRPETAGRVKSVALEYNLMSAYTAFVAVDSLTRTAGDHGTTVAVPVPVPEGVRYETTVKE